MRHRSELTVEFERLRDSLIEAIRDEKIARVESCLDVYRVAVEAFLDKLNEYGAVYDFKSARREASSLEGGWPEIEWIKDDLRVVIDAAIKYGSDDVLRKVVFFPLALATTALHERNYYVFEQFLSWVGFAYRRGVEVLQIQRRGMLTEMIATFTREVADYYVEPQLRYATAAQDIERYADFCRGIVIAFSDLMKAAFDARDVSGFRLFVTTLEGLFDGNVRHGETDEELLRWQLEHGDVNPAQRAEIETKLEVATSLQEANAQTQRARNEAFFGMGAWLIQTHLTAPAGVEDARLYYDAIPLRLDIVSLTDLFYGLWKQHAGERIFGWEMWVMENAPRRQAIAVNFDYYLSRFYCIKALETLQGTQNAASLPLNEGIVYLAAGDDSELRRAATELERNQAKLEPVVGAALFMSVEAFLRLLADAVDRQKRHEADLLVRAPVDEKRVERFIQNVVKQWRSNGVVRQMVKDYGVTHHGGEAPDGPLIYGFNVIDRKDVYVADSKLHADDWGSEYGRSIASTEDEVVMAAITQAARDGGPGGNASVIETLDNSLSAFGGTYEPNVIVLLNAWSLILTIERASEFRRADSSERFPGGALIGRYRGIPIFRVHSRAGRGHLLIIDLKRLGRWFQYEPRRVFDEERRVEVFNFLIKAYDEQSAREAIRKSPKLSVDPDTKQRQGIEEAVRRLQQRVHLRIVEQFEYRIEDPSAAVRLTYARKR
jgi:hypothetical protein